MLRRLSMSVAGGRRLPLSGKVCLFTPHAVALSTGVRKILTLTREEPLLSAVGVFLLFQIGYPVVFLFYALAFLGLRVLGIA